jgi:hypothetical protein
VFDQTFLHVRAGQDLAELRIGDRTHWVSAPVSGEVVTARVRICHPPPPVLFRVDRAAM